MQDDERGWKSQSINDGLIYEFLLGDKVIFYSVCMKSASKLKNLSAIFHNCEYILQDEYQEENGKYLPNEVSLMLSIVVSVNRGNGKNAGDATLILLGNDVSNINPWFLHFGIADRRQDNTSKIKGKGWIAVFRKSSNRENMINNNLNSVFSDTSYMKHVTTGSNLFKEYPISKVPATARCLHIINDNDVKYGIWYKSGKVYISNEIAICPKYCKFSMQVEDGYQRFNKKCIAYKFLINAFEKNIIYFNSRDVQSAILDILNRTVNVCI